MITKNKKKRKKEKKKNLSLQLWYFYVIGQNIITKTVYHTVNITSTEAELFAIRYRINQVIQVTDISYIIVITNVTHSVRYIFNLLTYSYQI